jgi:hypothetical protein
MATSSIISHQSWLLSSSCSYSHITGKYLYGSLTKIIRIYVSFPPLGRTCSHIFVVFSRASFSLRSYLFSSIHHVYLSVLGIWAFYFVSLSLPLSFHFRMYTYSLFPSPLPWQAGKMCAKKLCNIHTMSCTLGGDSEKQYARWMLHIIP